MAGIKEVAKQAGVAVGTVSRVINNNPTVNPDIRERVLEAIKELNYVPNEVARSFKLKTTKMVAFLIPSIDHPFFSKLAFYVEDELDKRGYKLMLCNSGGKPEKEAYYFDMLHQNKVAGILGISYNEHKQEVTKDIPFVSIDRRFSSGVTCVTSDNYLGGQMAAQALIQRGCKNIAFIGSSSALESEVHNRKEGFVAQAKNQGLEARVYLALDTDMSFQQLTLNFINENPDIEGVFAISDYLAATLIQQLLKKGISVPNQVKVIGYDGIQDNDLFHPILTTLVQPVQEMAAQAVEVLIKKINQEIVKDEVITIPCIFKEGETI